ncbi:amidase family protein [Aurantimonas sp. A2-1-M11]|uniref:amidase family protein n=1 Tax=Aurantimonas sp. A2-1-M11 TaxID=3113712 RepID=UPI002F93C7D5
MAARRDALERLDDLLGDGDVILLPATSMPACPLSDVDETLFPMSRLTRLANYLDLCEISVPVATTADGLPIAMQICARSGREDLAIAAASTLQAAMQLGIFPSENQPHAR